MKEPSRQGDVLIVPASTKFVKAKIPATAKLVAKGNAVLAEGETTGHAHRLIDQDVEMYHDPETELRFLRVLAEAKVAHEEHDVIVLSPGDYGLPIQVEVVGSEIRRVAD